MESECELQILLQVSTLKESQIQDFEEFSMYRVSVWLKTRLLFLSDLLTTHLSSKKYNRAFKSFDKAGMYWMTSE